MNQNIFIIGPSSPPELSALMHLPCLLWVFRWLSDIIFYEFYFKQMVSVSDRVLPYMEARPVAGNL